MSLVLIDAIEPAELAETRRLFREYAESLGFNLHFQQFEEEMASLPGTYVPPGGALLLASWDGRIAGCVGLRSFDGPVAELKRLYVRPEYRSHGIGGALSRAALARARKSGYRSVRLDTLPTMQAALRLYRGLGFREIPAYRYNPIPETVFLELAFTDTATE
jgi:ribosomal protein S18 acetylase RimI-like enzyme